MSGHYYETNEPGPDSYREQLGMSRIGSGILLLCVAGGIITVGEPLLHELMPSSNMTYTTTARTLEYGPPGCLARNEQDYVVTNQEIGRGGIVNMASLVRDAMPSIKNAANCATQDDMISNIDYLNKNDVVKGTNYLNTLNMRIAGGDIHIFIPQSIASNS